MVAVTRACRIATDPESNKDRGRMSLPVKVQAGYKGDTGTQGIAGTAVVGGQACHTARRITYTGILPLVSCLKRNVIRCRKTAQRHRDGKSSCPAIKSIVEVR
jgi:hypothetical protein